MSVVCPTCGKEIKKRARICKHCKTPVPGKRQKTKKLGNCAIIFAFFIPIIGLILGIFAVVFGCKRDDKTLRNDGIKGIVMSVIVTAVKILLFYVLSMLGFAAPFLIMTLA